MTHSSRPSPNWMPVTGNQADIRLQGGSESRDAEARRLWLKVSRGKARISIKDLFNGDYAIFGRGFRDSADAELDERAFIETYHSVMDQSGKGYFGPGSSSVKEHSSTASFSTGEQMYTRSWTSTPHSTLRSTHSTNASNVDRDSSRLTTRDRDAASIPNSASVSPLTDASSRNSASVPHLSLQDRPSPSDAESNSAELEKLRAENAMLKKSLQGLSSESKRIMTVMKTRSNAQLEQLRNSFRTQAKELKQECDIIKMTLMKRNCSSPTPKQREGEIKRNGCAGRVGDALRELQPYQNMAQLQPSDVEAVRSILHGCCLDLQVCEDDLLRRESVTQAAQSKVVTKAELVNQKIIKFNENVAKWNRDRREEREWGVTNRGRFASNYPPR